MLEKPAQRKAFWIELASLFPNCFSAPGAETKKALKRSIDLDIIASLAAKGRSVEPSLIRSTLHEYTVGRKYAEALARGGWRVGLNGEEVELLSTACQDKARQRLAKWDREHQPSVQVAAHA